MTVRYVALTKRELMPRESELAARLRAPRDGLSKEVGAALTRLTEIASPAATLAWAPLDGALRASLSLSGGDLENCSYIAVLAVTLGHAIDRELARARRRGAAEAFILDAVASAMAEAAADAAEVHLRSAAERIVWGRRRSPGYGRLPLSLQPLLLSLSAADRQLGITLTEASMMLPTKSITAILGGNEDAGSSD